MNTGTIDAKTDKQADLPAPGLMTVRMAPTHHGIEGSTYGMVALALSLKSATDSSTGLATSALFSRVANNALKFDPKGASPIPLQGPFPAFPEGAKYNFTDAAQGALGARTFKFSTDPGAAGNTLIRVVFTNDDEHRWVVYLDASKALSGFVLPKPPAAFATKDRTFSKGLSSGQRSIFLAQFLRLNDGALVDFNKFVEFNSTNGDRLPDLTTAFSLVDYTRPRATFTTPAAAGMTIAKASNIVVKVAGFKVPDDGFVKFSFTGGTGCTDLDGKTETMAGNGEVSVALPMACSGMVTIKATIFDNAGTPAAIKPESSTTITATIQ